MPDWQQHVSRMGGETARAPYNFVPPPARVFTPSDKELYGTRARPRYDEFREGLYTGYFDCTLTALTHLYIRGPRRDGSKNEARFRPDFYAIDAGGNPVLPGSSLRGAVRAVYEALTFSMVQPVNTEKCGGELPEGAKPADFVAPPDLNTRPPEKSVPDLATRVFGGFSDKKGQRCVWDREQIRGRVRFTNAEYAGGHEDPYVGIVIVPKLLLSPHPSSYRMYLVQTSEERDDRRTYALKRSGGTQIRGAKFYWHKWNDERGLCAVQEQEGHTALLADLQSKNPKDKTHTVMRCVKAGSKFRFQVHFHNLADVELAGLGFILRMADKFAMKVGMGKPLGLGSVRIKSDLHVLDHSARYTAWGSSGDTEKNALLTSAWSDFSTRLLQHCRETGECADDCTSLTRVRRMKELFTLLEFSTPDDLRTVDYMYGPATGVLPLASKVFTNERKPLSP